MNEILAQLPGPMVQVVYFFVALFPLVLVHELGHFLAAKYYGVRVDEFGIGFPPRLAKVFSAGGTDYTLNALPLGGFVRLAGEDDPSIPGAFAAKSKWARTVVLVAGPGANFLLAAVIFAGIAFMIGAAEPLPEGGGMVELVAIGPDSPAEAAGLEGGDMLFAVDGQLLVDAPVEGTIDVAAGETHAQQALIGLTDAHLESPMQVSVLRGLDASAAQVSVDGLITEPVAELAAFPSLDAARVTQAPAEGGLQAGDLILQGLMQEGDEALVLRGDMQLLTLPVQPRFDEAQQRGLMGVQIAGLVVTRPVGPLEAMMLGADRTVRFVGLMIVGLYQMFTGEIAAEIAGPVGISKLSADAGAQGGAVFFGFMALLSINLGIINLFPIPALDGGRLLFIGLEALRGRRIEPSREAVVHLIGFALVIGLMLVVTVYELMPR